MPERAPPKGLGAYLVQLVRTLVFPLAWLQAMRIARDLRDDDPRAPAKVAAAIGFSILLAGGAAWGLWDFRSDAESGMYGKMETRLSQALKESGQGSYQDATEAVAVEVAKMTTSARKLAELANASSADVQVQTQQTAWRSILQRASDAGLTLEDLRDAEAALADAASLRLTSQALRDAQATAGSAAHSAAARAQANATLEAAGSKGLTVESLMAAEAVSSQAQAANLTAARVAWAEEAAALPAAPADPAALAEHAAAALQLETILEQMANEANVEANAAMVVPRLQQMADMAVRLNASAIYVNLTEGAKWGVIHDAAYVAALAAVDDALALAEPHRIFLAVQPGVQRHDDAGVRATFAAAAAGGADLDNAAIDEAFAIKDAAQADMDEVYWLFLWPGVAGVFYAPLVFVLGGILRNAFVASDTVGFRPYPGRAGAWFLVLGGFGIPAIFFAAWMMKDIEGRAIEGQIAL